MVEILLQSIRKKIMANCILISGGLFNFDNWSKAQRNLGPYRVATELEDAGFSTFVFDYIVSFTVEEIKQVLLQHLNEETLWVGFSSTFYLEKKATSLHSSMWWTEEEEINDIINFIKQNSSAKIIYGGTKTEFVMGKNSLIDFYVLGLADTVIVPLSNSIRNDDYSKLLHCSKAKREDGTEYQWIDCRNFPEAQMDSIRTKWWLPQFNMIPGEATSIEFARGCIFKCKFCSFPGLGKKKGTYLRDAMEIRDDLMRIYDSYGSVDFMVTDDTVNDDTDKLIALRDAFATLPFKPSLAGFFRADLINRFKQQADIILDMGFNGVFFGIETLQPESAKSIGKGLHPKKLMETLMWLKHDKWKGRVGIGGNMILGLPYDTLDYFEELIETTLEDDFPFDHLSFSPLHIDKTLPTTPEKKKGLYLSEFGLNPEIYGYKFLTDSNTMWELPSQGLSYTFVTNISNEFNSRKIPSNKTAAFQMKIYSNLGIPTDDLHNLKSQEIIEKYDIPLLNEQWFKKYKNKILINSRNN
jgi:hypothetical protein